MGPVKQQHINWRELNEMKRKKKRENIEKYILAKKEQEKKVEEIQETSQEATEEAKPKKKSRMSLSIALPGSILNNAQSPELQTYLAGQIARAAAIYNIDEVVVYDDTASTLDNQSEEESETWYNCTLLATVLQYLECPQYLRKHFFPMTDELRYAGLLNPLDAPHHLRLNQESFFREGVVLKETDKQGHSYVNIGLHNKVKLDKCLQPGIRVTVKLLTKSETPTSCSGLAVSPSVPKEELGLYWGYEVRLAKCLSKVFTESPHKKGYNVLIGTSDKGDPLSNIEFKKKKKMRAIIVFGGLKGLEFALEQDKTLNEDDVRVIFDYYVNTCPNQGSRTIRTEEAVLISLALLKDKIAV